MCNQPWNIAMNKIKEALTNVLVFQHNKSFGFV